MTADDEYAVMPIAGLDDCGHVAFESQTPVDDDTKRAYLLNDRQRSTSNSDCICSSV